MKTHVVNASIWDGGGEPAYTGELLIAGRHIEAVTRPAGAIAAEGARRLDVRGMTVMPGLVELRGPPYGTDRPLRGDELMAADVADGSV